MIEAFVSLTLLSQTLAKLLLSLVSTFEPIHLGVPLDHLKNKMDFSIQFSKVNLDSKLMKDLDKKKKKRKKKVLSKVSLRKLNYQSNIIKEPIKRKRLASQKKRVLCHMTQMSLIVS